MKPVAGAGLAEAARWALWGNLSGQLICSSGLIRTKECRKKTAIDNWPNVPVGFGSTTRDHALLHYGGT